MSFQGVVGGDCICTTLKSAAAITKFDAVTIASQSDGECVACSSAGEQITGIALNVSDAAGQAVKVALIGVSVAIAGAAVTKGKSLQVDASGRLIEASSADEVCGYALTAAAAANDQFTVVLGYGGIY